MIDTSTEHSLPPLTETEVDAIFEAKYGGLDKLGSTPSLYYRFGYHNPDDLYECLVAKLVDHDSVWADVGCGHRLFPSNAGLGRELSARCRRLVGIDPDANIEDNPYIHEAARSLIDDYEPTEIFDLVTLRMVAEHIRDPDKLIGTLAAATRSGSLVVVYTVNSWSPVPLLTRLTPMRIRHLLKKWLWGTAEKDTFPTAYRMNTRRRLRTLFAAGGFEEVYFTYVDDCRTTSRFRPLLTLELAIRSLCRKLGIAYPENCLLGAYRRT